MYKNILQSIQDIEIWPAISLVIFFLFFTGILIWVMLMNKKHVREMENLPLEDGTVDRTSNRDQIIETT